MQCCFCPGGKPIPAILILMLAGIHGGCSSGPGELTCDWFYADNCWKRTLTEAMQCPPGERLTGLLDEDTGTCTYPGGALSRIGPPPSETGGIVTVETAQDGSRCLSFVWFLDPPSSSFALSTKSGTFSYTETGSEGTLVCPGGSEFFTDDVESLKQCLERDSVYEAYSVFGAGVSIGLRGPAGADLRLADCL
ncbi:MAG: hypothetical protein ABIJ56_14550 [Pseudomonadota bacterium]